MKIALFSAALVALSTGCIDTDTAVFVDATIDNPSLTVTEETLGTALDGSFELTLHLGARASGPSTVTFQSFSLESEDGTVLVESLPVSSPDQNAGVEPGGTDTVVTFTISTEDGLLESAVKDQICAGSVVVSGVIQDSLATSTTPVESEPFSPSGC